MYHGFGLIIYNKDSDKYTYIGQWERGLEEGLGLLSYKNGSYINGVFQKG